MVNTIKKADSRKGCLPVLTNSKGECRVLSGCGMEKIELEKNEDKGRR